MEDRLLFRLNTLDKTEFRMWLTRSKAIKLLELLEQAVKVNLQHQQRDLGRPALQAVMDFRRDAVLAEADYKTVLSEAESFPLGPQPILISDLNLETSGAAPVLGFQLAIGQSVNLSIDHDLGLAVSKLLTDVIGTTDWGLATGKISASEGVAAAGAMVMH